MRAKFLEVHRLWHVPPLAAGSDQVFAAFSPGGRMRHDVFLDEGDHRPRVVEVLDGERTEWRSECPASWPTAARVLHAVDGIVERIEILAERERGGGGG